MKQRKYLFLTLAPLLFIAACDSPSTGEPKPPKVSRNTSTALEKSPLAETETETEKQQAPKEKIFEEIEAPKAHFKKLTLNRVVEPVEVTPGKRTSVVLVVVDALNAAHMGLYGYERDTTPNLKKIALDGLTLTNFVSNSSWTRPSFTTIITGQPKSVHKIEWDGNSLDKDIKTLAERFRDAGYKTAGIFGNQLVQSVWGFDQGFQTFEDVKSLDQIHPRDSLLTTKAIDWLKTTRDDPFFLTIFLIDPHMPYRPLKAHRMYLDALPEGEVIRIPLREYPKPLPKLDHDRIVAAYDGEVHTSDEQIARLFEFLKESDKLKNTTVVITADHGEAFGEHNCYTHTYHMWESVLRVPFLIVSPSIPLKGAYDDRPFTHVDIAPTLLDLAGVEYKRDELPGLSIADVLRDPANNRERILFSQYNAHGVRRQAIRKGRWKLVHHHKVEESAKEKLTELQTRKLNPDENSLPSLAWDGERYEYYDLGQDPDEVKDLFSTSQNSPELKELMANLLPRLGDERAVGEISQEMLEALQNAGYIQKPEETEKSKKKE